MRVRVAAIEPRTWTLDPRGAARGRMSRTSLIVTVRGEDGRAGHGEAAPLADFSPDTLADARLALEAFTAVDVASYDDVVRVTESITAPSARFALETALLDLLSHGRIADVLPVVDVITSPPSTMVVEGESVPDAPVLKLKVGPELALDRILAVHHARPEARLRLDANRTIPREHVRGYLFALGELPVDYIEEPCVDAVDLLDEPLPCPIALDESLVTLSPAALDRALASAGLAALVLKPTVLGGFARCLALAGRGVPVVVTHALEGDIGRAAVEQLRVALEGARR